MQPVRFESKGAIGVIGVPTRVVLASADWGAIWNEGYMSRMAEIEQRSVGHDCLGVYFGVEEPGVVDFVAGRPAREGINVPDGLVLREIPAARYAVFECGMQELGGAWHTIYGGWLPASGFYPDESAACFEVFGPTVHQGGEPVRIHVPIKPKP